MRKVVVFTNLTLDGVMQATALPAEDLVRLPSLVQVEIKETYNSS